ncbi:hypothetical protein UZ36_06300 [Candidatus Nitromaritima sp. SCGC AAA799-C22]|nr:hypothetical protein UZ36_06300 [Candidatus Nitromaritima sp. SCGC AAA799-C22]
MSWMLGAGMGFLRGGPMGAVIGGALQHIITRKLQQKIRKSLPGLDDQCLFVTCAAVVMTKTAMSRGPVTGRARGIIRKFFRKNLNYSDTELGFIDKVIEETQRVNPDLQPIVKQYRDACRDHYTSLLLALAYQVVLVDGELSDDIQKQLNQLSGLLGLSYQSHDTIREKYCLEALKTPYTVLGIPASSTDDEVKKAYRKMARLYHPDKVAHQGEEQAQEAHMKFLEIMEAYQELEKARDL